MKEFSNFIKIMLVTNAAWLSLLFITTPVF